MNSVRTRVANHVCWIAAAAAAAGCSVFSPYIPASGTPVLRDRPTTAKGALERLVAGNQRFASFAPAIASTSDLEQMFVRNEAGQAPYATILTCADSRLSPSMLFDEFLGELFVVREAGNIAVSPTNLGSLEYAHLVLNTPLLVVMGHQHCGAVDAAFKKSDVPGNIKSIVEVIEPGIAGASSLDDAIVRNVGAVIASIRASSPALSGAAMVGAVYDHGSGRVRFLDHGDLGVSSR